MNPSINFPQQGSDYGPTVPVPTGNSSGQRRVVQNEKAFGSLTHQAITVAQGHFAGVRLVLKVSHIVAVRRVRATPRQAPPLPIFHPELSRQQASLQREVEQEVVA